MKRKLRRARRRAAEAAAKGPAAAQLAIANDDIVEVKKVGEQQTSSFGGFHQKQ